MENSIELKKGISKKEFFKQIFEGFQKKIIGGHDHPVEPNSVRIIVMEKDGMRIHTISEAHFTTVFTPGNNPTASFQRLFDNHENHPFELTYLFHENLSLVDQDRF